MNNVQAIPTHNSNETTLEELLQSLTKYGKPRLSLQDRGWYCAIDMHVSAAGVDFKVGSDFNLPTPTAAAMQCMARLEKAVSSL